MKDNNRKLNRREFIKTSVAAGAASLIAGNSRIFADGSDKIRVGLVGCGRRGIGAVMDCAKAFKGVELVAMGDLFKERVDKGADRIKKRMAYQFKVTPDNRFAGFDAYKKVIACDVDLVLLVTPPGFRPIHLKAAVEAGKHVFTEKPVAVDPVGVRSIIASSELAKEKNLAIVAGTQRRHQHSYIEIMKRIHNGQIGDIVAAQCYWVGDYSYYPAVKKEAGFSDMEWQCRNWNYFTWLSGDHIVEQHVHNIDIMNWALKSHPVLAMGMGGRQQRTGPEFGNIYDHFTIEFEYPGGVRVTSMCRQMKGCSDRISERVAGTKGVASITAHGSNAVIEGEDPYKYDGTLVDPYMQEHIDLIASIREGKRLNEGLQISESTMAGIMGRISAYTGRALKWEWAMEASKLDLSPEKYEFGDLPVRDVAVPGQTKLI